MKRSFFMGAIAALAFGIGACGGNETAETTTDETAGGAGEEATEAAQGGQGEEVSFNNLTLSGAGASFPAPLYQTWFSQIGEEYPGLQINYQSVGSGAGIEQYLSGTVDFGATDAPLTEEERQSFIDQYGSDPIQVPMTGGLVTFAYNLPEVEGNLQLTQDAYCGIVTGEITQWDAEPIASANPDLTLPSEPITFVHRSDGSGTTFLFTNHINEVCGNWQGGAAKTVDWPVGVGAQGNEGIAAQVQQTEGAIGYVEYTYASENDIPVATLENAAGNFIEPSPDAAAVAFEDVTVPDDFALLIPNPEGDQSYPIVGLTWMLIYPEYDNEETAKAIETIVDWAQNNGAQYAQELGYIPLPQGVSDRVKSTVEEALGGA
ncbi:MAG: phosphate ABC transporter substrate-binding protein PstS [Synechococcales bacterium]|nr:phosphate ABC transporter substrate-binding protein PstS [Synechococcales bacterium]